VADLDTTTLTQAALVGIFSPVIERLNFVNAALILKEREVRLTEARDNRARDFASLITIRAQTPDGEREVSGRGLFDGKNPRLVRVNGFSLEAIPKGGHGCSVQPGRSGSDRQNSDLVRGSWDQYRTFSIWDEKEIGGIAVAIIQVDSPLSARTIDGIERGYRMYDPQGKYILHKLSANFIRAVPVIKLFSVRMKNKVETAGIHPRSSFIDIAFSIWRNYVESHKAPC